MKILLEKLLATPLRQVTTPIVVFFVTSTVALGQSLTSEYAYQRTQYSYDLLGSQDSHSSSLFSPPKSPAIEEPYRPITHGQRLHWFVSSTIGPAHLAGVAFVSGCATAVNHPGEYGPHWEGFANRFGMGIAGGATDNAMEAGMGLIFREDPRYYRAPQQAFKYRVGNVARFTFFARSESGRSVPAYARYFGIVGGNFLSNSWRVPGEASAQAAILRASEGFAGRMAANAFKEYWPDLKAHVFRIHDRATGSNTRNETEILPDKLKRP